ncbi:vWA domain-containing protein [Gemmobacter caeruleus]|uniref:vWA domain-containing protein n=1 Tax=Gemmobacter caeruleus TaxID=2595004 RepID=UPI001396B922|nr:VWA domain-containing protein [Gemmobacter caeruleus]
MRMGFLALLCAGTAGMAAADGRSIIVLDGSGSMWGQIDGRPKLEIAREALGQVLASIPPETELGLMAYGHRSKGDCGDIELIVPPAAGSGPAIANAANAMKFLGKTPLSESVRRAAAELRATEEKATVILITDGIETCEADPCAVATELEQQGIDFTAHVVGFGLTQDEGRQVACLAENTGGKYIEAKDAGALVEALKTTVAVAEPAPAPAPEPPPAPPALENNVDPVAYLAPGDVAIPEDLAPDVVFEFFAADAEGKPQGDGQTIYGTAKGALPPGRYVMRATLHKAVAETAVEIGPQSETSLPAVTLEAGVLNLTLRASPGAEPDPEAFWELRGADDLYETGYAKARRVFPAGEHALMAKLGVAETQRSVVIEPGRETDLDVVLGVGHAVIDTFYTGEMTVEDGQYVEVFEAAKDIEGNRKSVAYAYGPAAAFDLPPGDYVVVSSLGAAKAEAPLKVETGQRAELRLVLEAGVAAFTGADGVYIEILSATKDINGERKSIAYGYGPAWQTAIAAGDYIVKAEAEGKASEVPFTVKPGERTELAVAP